jgi:hypothetical protein
VGEAFVDCSKILFQPLPGEENKQYRIGYVSVIFASVVAQIEIQGLQTPAVLSSIC